MRKNTVVSSLLTLCSIVALPGLAHAQTTIGAYTFNDNQFGNSLLEPDGGTFRNNNWINTANANPGNPAALTGANFNTGIANLDGQIAYTIGYNTPIVNGTGSDLGVVVARFDVHSLFLEVSTDGVNFLPGQSIVGSSAVGTGVTRSYYYTLGNGPYSAELFVHAIDLTSFGLATGASIQKVRITGESGLDLVRAAGLNPVPEPATFAAFGAASLAFLRRRRAR